MAARRIGHAVELTVRAARQVIPERRVLSFVKRERRPELRPGRARPDHPSGRGRPRPLGATRRPAARAAGRRAGQPARTGALPRHRAEPRPARARAAGPLAGRGAGGAARSAVRRAAAWSRCGRRSIWPAASPAGFPCWEPIQARPQHNPIHRHTVDRHSVQTVAEASRHLTRVDRPDILLLACLFHDIGKLPGAGTHHAAVGAPIARRAVEAIGLDGPDADLVELLVREHLTLAALATKRDHGDPATIDALVEAVQGRADVLDLLRCLTEADARAAGPAAWSPWRAQLINSLADHAAGMLVDEGTPGRRDEAGRCRAGALGQAGRQAADPGRAPARRPAAGDRRPGPARTVQRHGRPAGLARHPGALGRAAHRGRGLGEHLAGGQAGARRPARLAYLVKQLERLDAGESGILDSVRRREARARSRPGTAEAARRAGARRQRERGGRSRSGPATGPGCSTRSARRSARRGCRSGRPTSAPWPGQAIDTFYVTEADGSPPHARSGAARRSAALTAAADADRVPAAQPGGDQVVHLGRGGRLGAAPRADDRRRRRPPPQRVLEVEPELDPRRRGSRP